MSDVRDTPVVGPSQLDFLCGLSWTILTLYLQVILLVAVAAGNLKGTSLRPLFLLSSGAWAALLLPMLAVSIATAGFSVLVGVREGGRRLSRLLRDLPIESHAFARIDRSVSRVAIGLWVAVVLVLGVRWYVG
jgi:hypothetical protein